MPNDRIVIFTCFYRVDIKCIAYFVFTLKVFIRLLLGKLDEIVQTYIHGLSSCGAVIIWAVANAAAKALMKKYSCVIDEIDVDSSYWAQSLFRRMDFTKQRKTSTKVSLFTVAFRSSVCSPIISKTILCFFLNFCLKLYTLKCFKHTKGFFSKIPVGELRG